MNMTEESDPTKFIPHGIYCYDERGKCPFWSIQQDKPNQRNGYCSFLKQGDWEVRVPPGWPVDGPLSALSLLWDQCKNCGVNEDVDESELI